MDVGIFVGTSTTDRQLGNADNGRRGSGRDYRNCGDKEIPCHANLTPPNSDVRTPGCCETTRRGHDALLVRAVAGVAVHGDTTGFPHRGTTGGLWICFCGACGRRR